MLYTSANTTQSFKTATGSNAPKVSNSFKKSLYPWHHSLDRKHTYLYVNSEGRLYILFTRNSTFKKKSRRFHGRWSVHFSEIGV
jgi:hypothetical protein